MMFNISEHFTLYEARCRCGCGIEKLHVPEISAQAAALEAFRAGLNADPELARYLEGSPSGEFRLFALSWIRCERHNKAVGGAGDSQHLPGHCDATDITCPELPAIILYDKAQDYFPTAIYYPDRHFVHCDRRVWPDGEVHAWVNNPAPTEIPGDIARA